MTKEKLILIVEDEPIVSLNLSHSLRQWGYAVKAVNSADKAVSAAGDSAPRLILMDVRLKGTGDGITAAQAILSRQSVPIIFLSAYTDETMIKRIGSLASCGYLSKPFEDQELKRLIERSLL